MVFLNFNNANAISEISINELASRIQAGQVSKIVEDDNALTIVTIDQQEFTSTKESNSTLVEQLIQFGVTAEDLQSSTLSIQIKQPGLWTSLLSLLSYLLPFIFIAIAFFSSL
jgi:ATP-dependent Zn protease